MRRTKTISTRVKRRASERIANEIQKDLNIMVKQCMNLLRLHAGHDLLQEHDIKSMDHEWYRYVRGRPDISDTQKSTLLPLFSNNIATLLRQINNPPPESEK